MKSITVKVAKRTEKGKKYTKKIRKEGLVPGVLYGGKENVLFEVTNKELKKIIFTNQVYIIDLDVEGTVYKCIKKDVQFHPVSDDTLHIDFLEVQDDKPIELSIPVEVTGFAEGVKQGGFLFTMKRYIKIKALLKDIPDVVTVDVTELALGKTFTVSDLVIENVEILDIGVIVMVKLSRTSMSAAGDEEEEEGEESVEGENAEGEVKEEEDKSKA